MDAMVLKQYEAMLRELRATLESTLEPSRATAAPVALDESMGRISRCLVYHRLISRWAFKTTVSSAS